MNTVQILPNSNAKLKQNPNKHGQQPPHTHAATAENGISCIEPVERTDVIKKKTVSRFQSESRRNGYIKPKHNGILISTRRDQKLSLKLTL